MNKKADPILIAGGGCAGLSLAIHLVEQRGFDHTILLVESRGRFGYENDRTWSGFRTTNHRFSSLAARKWNTWVCRTDTGENRSRSVRYPYESIRASDYYEYCLRRLEQDPRVTLRFGSRVVESGNGTYLIVDDSSGVREEVSVSHLYDSRPPQSSVFSGNDDDILLWQQFVGLEVVADADRFEPEAATLMDFRVDQRGGIRFIYVLPFSSRRALVEATVFAPSVESPVGLTHDVEKYLREVCHLSSWTIERSESGRIPMTTAEIETNPKPNVTRIGLSGGMARPSTGYAFLAIQEHSRRIARSYGRGRFLSTRIARPISKILDRIFLSYLTRFPERAAGLFMEISKRTDPDRFARFMMETGGILDKLSVIMSMPKLPFIAEAWRSRKIWLMRSSENKTFDRPPVESVIRP